MRHSSIAFLTASLLLLSACRTDDSTIGQTDDGFMVIGESEVEETTVRGVSPGLRTLVFDGFHGDIRLSGSSDPNADLEFTKRARADDDTGARRLLGDVNVDEAGTDESYTFTMTSNLPAQSSVDMSGTVGASTPLRIDMESGTIDLAGLDGPLDITNRNGDVLVEGTGHSVTIETRNGNISLGMRLVPADASISITTQNGDLTLRLPSTTSAQIDARTSAGGIRASEISFLNRRLQRSGAGTRLTGQLGQGNATINLRTENGSITIEEGRVMEEPVVDPLDTATDTLESDPGVLETVDPDTLEDVSADADTMDAVVD